MSTASSQLRAAANCRACSTRAAVAPGITSTCGAVSSTCTGCIMKPNGICWASTTSAPSSKQVTIAPRANPKRSQLAVKARMNFQRRKWKRRTYALNYRVQGTAGLVSDPWARAGSSFAARIALQKISQSEDAHGHKQKLQHEPRIALIELGDDRQRRDDQTNKHEETGQRGPFRTAT